MTFNIDSFIGEIDSGGGHARSNYFRVIFPVIPNIAINLTGVDVVLPTHLNVLCKNLTLPSRLLQTVDKQIGVVNEKVVYGYVNEPVSFSFLGLNNYAVRKYFENWHKFILNPDNGYAVRYKKEYARSIIIQNLDAKNRVIYSIELEDAFPIHLKNIELGNDNNTPVVIGVTCEYTAWRQRNVLEDALATVIAQNIDELLL